MSVGEIHISQDNVEMLQQDLEGEEDAGNGLVHILHEKGGSYMGQGRMKEVCCLVREPKAPVYEDCGNGPLTTDGGFQVGDAVKVRCEERPFFLHGGVV